MNHSSRPTATPGGPTPAERGGTPSSWWRDAVVYQVYPRSFADSDGDGIGDLPGIRSRLDHLRDLGVDAVWISPFYVSPQADGGYDVTDYRRVDPLFGTLDDADALLRTAHEQGIRVIVDLVPNHCSEQHPWFRAALEDGPGSPFRERFHFRPGRGAGGELPPNDWESVFGGPAWTRIKDADGQPGEWYLHLFAPQQPDLNWDSPAVRGEFRDVLRFWLDRGVDGFRVDVAHGLVKAPGLPDQGDRERARLLGTEQLPFFDQDGVHEIYRDWRALLDTYPGDRVLVAEAWAPTVERTARYVRRDEMHQAFNFAYLATYWDPKELRGIVDSSLAAMRGVGAAPTWVLSNHDVTRHTTRFGNPAGSGTQQREPGDRDLGLRRARAATLFTLALPGSAYLYQGEELGLPDVTDLSDEVRQDPSYFRASGQDGFRDGCRVPIPWTWEGPSYGFGPGDSWLPQPDGWGELSVAAQTGVAGSTLELYRSALTVRRDHPCLGALDDLVWSQGPEGVLVFERSAGETEGSERSEEAGGSSGAEVFTCTANTSGEERTLPAPGRLLLASGPVEVQDGEVVLPADTTAWWSRNR